MLKNFSIAQTKLKGVLAGNIISKGDERGYFERVFCENEYQELIARDVKVRQINRSFSKIKGTVRGCHFQWPPFAETKIVSCTRGRLFDLAVDLRIGSPTYLEYFSLELTSENKKFLVIPEGFAHGFQTLEENTEILYFVTKEFSQEHDDGINPLDPSIGIKWPLEIALRSEKDTKREFLIDRNFSGIKVN